jgi:hypothetical protein
MKKSMKLAALAASLGLVSVAASATPNLVVNPGFENDDVGWTISSIMDIAPFANLGTKYVHSGSYAARTNCVGHGCVSTLGSGSYVAQALNTTAGQSYDLSFWVGESSGPISEFSVFWNGQQIADVLNPANFSEKRGDGSMFQFTFQGLLANSNSTWLEVHGRQDPGGIAFDDFSVTPNGALPEPGTLAILGAGLGLLGVTLRRKRAC